MKKNIMILILLLINYIYIGSMDLSINHLNQLPVELKLNILLHFIKPIVYQNDIYEPLKDLNKSLFSITLISKKFYHLKGDFIKIFKSIAKKRFCKEISKQHKNQYQLNKELEKVFCTNEEKAVKLVIAGADPDLLVEYKKEDKSKEKVPLLLALAATNKFNKLAKVLISYGAKINIKDAKGISVLMYAGLNSNKELSELLIKNNMININAQDNEGDTALILTIPDRNIVNILINHNVDVNIKNHLGITPIMRAIQKGCQEIVLQLVEAGANVNVKTNSGTTPLIIATDQGNSSLVELLIRHGANINDTNNNGITPLMIAVHKGYDEIINILLSNNAAIDIQNISGQTAQEMALPSKKDKILKLFKLYKKKATKSCQLY